jgi:biotin operon repressor
MTTGELLSALTGHIGKANGISADHLAQVLGCNARKVRVYISQARRDGAAVCGTPETGYYIAANAEELEETCQFLRSRALHSLSLEAVLRRVPLVDLIGQLHLRT